MDAWGQTSLGPPAAGNDLHGLWPHAISFRGPWGRNRLGLTPPGRHAAPRRPWLRSSLALGKQVLRLSVDTRSNKLPHASLVFLQAPPVLSYFLEIAMFQAILSCMTLEKLLNLSVPQFPLLKTRDNNSVYRGI